MVINQLLGTGRNRIVTLCALALLAPLWLLPARQLPSPGGFSSERLSTHWGVFGWLETVTHRSGEVVSDIFFDGSGLVFSLQVSLLLVLGLAAWRWRNRLALSGSV